MKKQNNSDIISKSVLNGIPLIFACYDVDFHLEWANEAMVKTWGKSFNDLIGKSHPEIWRFVEAEKYNFSIETVKKTRKVWQQEIELKDGRVWSIRTEPVFDAAGKLTGFAETIQDLSIEKENYLLKKMEQQYLALIKSVNNLAIILDKNLKIHTILGERFEISTLDVQDGLSAIFHSLYPCPEGQKIVDYCKNVCETGKPFSVECEYEFDRMYHADMIYVFPIIDENHILDKIGILCRDITSRKIAEKALQQNEKTLKDIIEFLPDATFVIDKQGKVIAWNRAIELMTGVPKEEMLGKGDYIYATPFYDQRRPTLVDLIFSEDSPYEATYSNLKRFGKTLIAEAYIAKLNQGKGAHLWVIASPLYNNTGELVGSIESIRDISERKQAEIQLKTTLEEKEALLRELYHRTKNNMQMISSMLSLQTDFIKDKQVITVFKDMEYRIRSMALVHQRLYQSRNLSSIDLAEYLNELIGLLLQSYSSHPDLISINLDAEPITVLIDTAIPCGLIVNELVSNALKYAFPDNRKGSISITLSKPVENEILLTVSDDGISVPPDFDFHNDSRLGLQIVFALGKQQLGGKVSFETRYGFTCSVQFPFPQ